MRNGLLLGLGRGCIGLAHLRVECACFCYEFIEAWRRLFYPGLLPRPGRRLFRWACSFLFSWAGCSLFRRACFLTLQQCLKATIQDLAS